MALSTISRFSFVNSSRGVFRHCPKILRVNQQSVRFFPAEKSKRLLNILKKDGIPESFELVYRNPAARYVQTAQAFSLVVGISFSVAMIYASTLELTVFTDGFGPSNMKEVVIGSVSLIATCILLQVICYKSPLRIYSDTKKFIIVAYGPLGPLTPRAIEFNAGSCVKASPGLLTVLRDCRYKINGKIYYIFEDHFKSNADYNRMMGL